MADGILSIGADVSPMVRDVRAAYARLQNEINSKGISIDASKAGRSLSSLTVQSERLSKSLSRSAEVFLSIASVSSAIYGTQRAFVALVQSVRETELAFAQIQSILQASSGNFKQFQKDIFQVANQTGTSFSAAAEVANEFARQGLNLNDTLVRTKDALTLVRLSGLGTAEAVSSLTAVVNTFRNEALNSTEAVERLANVSAAYAVSENDLALALQRTGAAAADSGVNFNQLISVITALQERTARGGSVIGNGLKSIFTRTQSTETLDLLEELGVKVRDVEGSTRPVLDILTELAKKFQTLSSAEKSAVTEATAGIYQVNTLQALLADLSSEYSVYSGALTKAGESTNQASTRTAVLNETLDALFIRTQNNLQQFNSGVGALTIEPVVRDILGGLNTIFTEFQKFEDDGIGEILLRGIGEFISGPALILLGGALAKIGKSFAIGFSGAIKDLAAIGGFANKYAITQAQVDAVLKSQNETHVRIISAAKTEEQQAQAILRVMKMITQETQAQAAYFASTTANVNRVAVGKPIKSKAGGFLPEAIARESLMVKKGIGGASGSAKPVVVKGFNTGKGSETIVANTDEYIVKNYDGSGADAVFNKDMLRSIGGLKNLKFLGEVSKVSAGGFVPNYAAGDTRLKGPKGKFLKVEKETVGLAENLKEYSEANKQAAKELKSQQKYWTKIRKQSEIIASKLEQSTIAKNTLEQDPFLKLSNLTKGDALSKEEKRPLRRQASSQESLLSEKNQFDELLKQSKKEEKSIVKKLEKIAQESKIITPELGRQTKENQRVQRESKKAFEAARSKRSEGPSFKGKPLNIRQGTPEYNDRAESVLAQRAAKQEEAAILARFTKEESDKKRNESLRAKAKIAAGTAAPENTGILSYDEVRKKAELKLQNQAIEKKVQQDLINEGRIAGPKPPKVPDDPETVLRNKRSKKAQLDAINAKLDKEELDKARADFKKNQDLQRIAARQNRQGVSPNRPAFGTQAYSDTLTSRLAERDRKNALRAERFKAQDIKAQKSANFGASLQKGQLAAFGASFILPTIGEGLKGDDEKTNQGIKTGVDALSTGAAIFATFPNQIGLIAAAVSVAGIGIKGFVDIASQVGESAESIKKKSDEQVNKTNEVANSIRGYVTAQNQLNDAIAAGAGSSAIQELRAKTLDSLFQIKDSSIRNRVIDVSQRTFTDEEKKNGIDQFSEFQKIVDSQVKPSSQLAGQREFAAILQSLDKERLGLEEKVSRVFRGGDKNLEGVGYDSSSSELVSSLVRALGSDNILSSSAKADEFLNKGGSPENFLKSLGLNDAAETLTLWSEKLGLSKDLLVETLAIDLKAMAIDQTRIEAEKKLGEATLVSRNALDQFAKGVNLSAKVLNNSANRKFALDTFRVSNNTNSGVNPVADAFRESALARAEAINSARSETSELKGRLIEQSSKAKPNEKISQVDLRKRLDTINATFGNFKDGNLEIGKLIDLVKSSSDEDSIGSAEIVEALDSTGNRLTDALTQVKEKLSADLVRIKESNDANRFGGLGAVSNEDPFKAGNNLFQTELKVRSFQAEKIPRDKEGRKLFNEKGAALSRESTSARQLDFNERLNNGVVRSQIDSGGAVILDNLNSKLGDPSVSKDQKKSLVEESKAQISKLLPEYSARIKDQENILVGQASDSFSKDLSAFDSSVPDKVSGRSDYKKAITEIEDALKAGYSVDQINLGKLEGIVGRSRNPEAQAKLGTLQRSKIAASNNALAAKADSDKNGLSDVGQAAVEGATGIVELKKAVDAMVALGDTKTVQDQIAKNTLDAATFLGKINGNFDLLKTEFSKSSEKVAQRESALTTITSIGIQDKLSLSDKRRENLSTKIASAKEERGRTRSVTTGNSISGLVTEVTPAIPKERMKELDDEIKKLENSLLRQEEESKRLKGQLNTLNGSSPNGQPTPIQPSPTQVPVASATSSGVTVQPTSQTSSKTEVNINSGTPLEVNVSIAQSKVDGEIGKIIEDVVNSEVSKFRTAVNEQLQRSMDVFAQRNNLTRSINPATVS